MSSSAKGDSNTFCADRFWDSNLTWYTANPEFTHCFQQTALVAAPCIGLWLAAALNIALTWKYTSSIHVIWTPLNITKLVLSMILCCISIVQLAFSMERKNVEPKSPDIDIYASSIKIMTYVLVIILILRNRAFGKKSSTLLTLFWLVMTICGAILFRSTILHAFYKDFSPIQKDQYIPDLVYYPILFCQFFISLFPDKTVGIPLEEKSPIETAPFFSYLTFYWFFRLIFKGRKNLLTLDDIPPMPSKLESIGLWKLFDLKWQPELMKYQAKVNSSGDSKNIPMPSLPWVLVKALWPWLVLACLLQLVDDFAMFLSPLLLDYLMEFIKNKDYMWKGYMYCIGFFFAEFFTRLAYNFLTHYTISFALQVRNAMYSAVYRKSLKLSSSARRKYTTGEIVNFVSVDVEKLFDFSSYCTYCIGAPVKFILTVAFLWRYLGVSCLSGIAVLFLLMIGIAFVSRRVNALQEKQMEQKDFRSKFLAEILNGIKVLKLYAWEIPFVKKILDIREKEVNLIQSFQLYYAAFSFVWGSAAFLFAISAFVTYTLIDENHVLDPATVFVSLNLLNIMKNVVLEVPELIADAIQTRVSVRRLTKFLISEEKNEETVGDAPDQNEVISIRNAALSWGRGEEPTLKNIQFHVPKGSLVAVIGPVGSGKSSLLSAILGEMYKDSGTIDVKGQIAYVPQQAWILNQTVKDNILFVKPMSRSKYNNILDACCLKSDLEILPAGDSTEIGEKGVNLSGGQKQRISLARAVYHNADIYLFDDPLSAVDAHVGKHIFEHVIGKNGLLKNKSRVLVTHSVSVLPEVDIIITMKDGEMQEIGTYHELMSKKSFFAEFMQEYAKSKTDTEDDDIGDIGIESETRLNFRKLAERSISVQSRERTVSADSKGIDSGGGTLIEEESMEVGEVKRETFLAYGRNMGIGIIIAVIFSYFNNQAFEIGANVWLSKWSSDPPPVNGTQDIPLRNLRISVYSVLGLLQGISLVSGAVFLAVGAARAAKCFHENMLQCIIKAPMAFFDTTPLGRVLNRFNRDTDEIDTGFPMQIDGWIYCLLNTIGTFIIIATNTPTFIPFVIPLSLLYYLIQKLYLKTSRQLKRLTSTTRSPVYSHLTESVQGSSSINAYRVSNHFILKAEEKMNTNCLCRFTWSCCARWLNFHLSLIAQIIILLTAILAVVSKDKLGPAIVGLSLTYALSVTDSLSWLVRTGTELENKSVSIERVIEYSNVTPEAPWEITETQPSVSWPALGRIQFKNYSTRYRENLGLVLDDVNLQIKESEKVGVVGRTGAGKSSFALALFRIIEPFSGTIEIDEVDVTKIGLHQLRKKLTIIPQDPVLFTGSLRTNLDPSEVYSDDEVWWSLEHANLKTFVSSLPEGLSHDVAEGGSNLSVGQRQLICLARALLKKTKILVLDEATAAVDVETDHLIQNTIRTEFKDQTVITIAHRLNTIIDYDRVLVMDAGKISEIGNPADLLQSTSTKFYKMAKDAGLV